MKTQQTKHQESGCTDYLQHNAETCPHMNTPAQAPQTSHSPLPKSHTMDCLSKGDASVCPICKPINDAAIKRALEQMRRNVVPALSVCVVAEAYDALQARAQRLSDALKAVIYTWEHDFKGMETVYEGTALEHDYIQAREALAQWEGSK